MEEVSCVDLLPYVVEGRIIAVGDDGPALLLETGEVVDNEGTEECRTVRECRLVDDDLGPLCLDSLHDALDRGLAEVVGIGLHREALDTDGNLPFLLGIV